MKKFFQMFAVSVVLFLFFSMIDDYEALVLPFLMKPGGERARTIDSSTYVSEELREFITNFNSMLSDIYASSDPMRVMGLPADDSLKKSLIEDLEFLNKSNKVMMLKTEDTAVKDIKKLSQFAVRVETREKVSLSYLNLSNRMIIMPERTTFYKVAYTLEMRGPVLTVARIETLQVED